jgi:hypothetical protein
MLVVVEIEFDPYSEYCCPYDEKRFKRFTYGDFPACFVYDVNGRLRFVCRRFVPPKDFSVTKHLSPKDMKGENGYFWVKIDCQKVERQVV